MLPNCLSGSFPIRISVFGNGITMATPFASFSPILMLTRIPQVGHIISPFAREIAGPVQAHLDFAHPFANCSETAVRAAPVSINASALMPLQSTSFFTNDLPIACRALTARGYSSFLLLQNLAICPGLRQMLQIGLPSVVLFD